MGRKSAIRNPQSAMALALLLGAVAGIASAEFYKNTAGQKMMFFARDMATGLPKTGDAVQVTAYVSIDGGDANVMTDTSAAEVNATSAPGWYVFDVNQHETDGDLLLFAAVSSTSDVNLSGCLVITRAYTVDANGLLKTVIHATSADANLLDSDDIETALETILGELDIVTLNDFWRVWAVLDTGDVNYPPNTFGGRVRAAVGKR